jgi:hypothetical protein
MAESSLDISGLGLDGLKALLVQALEKIARLEKENADLREEIARLKGLKGRPKFKPSGMEHALGLDPGEGNGRFRCQKRQAQRPARRQTDKAYR